MDRKQQIRQIMGRFIVFVLASGVIIAGSVLMSQFGPSEYKYTDSSFNWEYDPTPLSADNNIIFDQHSHTLYSDGILTVRQNVLWHLANGFNACMITDHNTMDHKAEVEQVAAEFADEIIVMVGMEWTTNRLHMNFLGLDDWDFSAFPIPSNPTDQQIQDAIDEAHNQNAVVTINHIPWSIDVAGMENHPTRKQLLNWDVDYIEVINEDTYDSESVPWCNDTNGFGIISGTDMHSPDHVWGWTGMNTTEFTETAIMDQLIDRNTTIYYNEDGSPDNAVGYEDVWYNVFEPLVFVGEMFENYYSGGVDWAGVSVFAAWMIGAFVIVEFYRAGRDRFWKRVNKRDENES